MLFAQLLIANRCKYLFNADVSQTGSKQVDTFIDFFICLPLKRPSLLVTSKSSSAHARPIRETYSSLPTCYKKTCS